MLYTLHMGSNSGDRVQMLQSGIDLLNHIGRVVTVSSLYETEPWGVKDQANFVNIALQLEANIAPKDLLVKVKDIERSIGRVETSKWGPRVLDIDIIFADKTILKSDILTIPHPHMENRNFVLIPLMEIMGNFVHPISHNTIEDLYIASSDICEVWIIESHKLKY